MEQQLGAKTGFPNTSRCVSDDGIEMILTKYADQWLVYASELGKVGFIVQGRKDSKETTGKDTYTVQIMLGDREDMWMTILARQLVERTYAFGGLPLVLMSSLNLKDIGDDEKKQKIHKVLALFESLAAPPPNE